jgi:hypothetical protein
MHYHQHLIANVLHRVHPHQPFSGAAVHSSLSLSSSSPSPSLLLLLLLLMVVVVVVGWWRWCNYDH